jgi:protein-S-isoprenylcysteine O-methyltransferase Ste14
MMLNSWWGFAAVLPLVYLLQQQVIRREEAYLEQKFGDSYLAYKRRVRRWL